MAKLRHLALSVKDLEESARFYESAGPESERKYRDPNGIVIDVTSKAHAESSWRVPTDS